MNEAVTNAAYASASETTQPNRRPAYANARQCAPIAAETCSVVAAESVANRTPSPSARNTLIGPAMSGRPLIQPVARWP
jgi:hypothetical protein